MLFSNCAKYNFKYPSASISFNLALISSIDILTDIPIAKKLKNDEQVE